MKVKRVAKAGAATAKEVKALNERLDALQETVTVIGNVVAALRISVAEQKARLEKVEADTKPRPVDSATTDADGKVVARTL